MSHIKVLMIGNPDNLYHIYAECPDSSSESAAEMAFGYDSLSPYDIVNHKDCYFIGEDRNAVFTKKDTPYKEYVHGGMFYDAWDIRDDTTDHLLFSHGRGDTDFDTFIFSLDALPEDTEFFFCDAHL